MAPSSPAMEAEAFERALGKGIAWGKFGAELKGWEGV